MLPSSNRINNMTKKTFGYVVLTGLLSCGIHDAGEERAESNSSTSSVTQSLFIEAGAALWDRAIPICFAKPTEARALPQPPLIREKKIIKEAIERTWLKVANINAIWYGDCPTTGDVEYLKITLGPQTEETDPATGKKYWGHSSAGQSKVGMRNTLTKASTRVTIDGGISPGMTIWTEYAGTSEQMRLEYVAIHEFGHVLGFIHEQQRPEREAAACYWRMGTPPSSGTTVGLYDPESIMNYCADTVHGYLSDGDIRNLRLVYDRKSKALPNALADINADGRADAIMISSSGVETMISDGSKFTSPRKLTPGAFYGNVATLFADVNGDGMTDGIAVNTTGNWVILSDGTSFTWTGGGKWSDAFYGSYGTHMADVNGDGKSDIIAVNSGGIVVMLSDGTRFGSISEWATGQHFGTRRTLLGDVNGDGKADLVAMDGDGTYVELSTGSKFGSRLRWTTDSVNSIAAAIMDFNNDGKNDLITINPWAINVNLSNGTAFLPNITVTNGPYYGTQDSLIGDVNNDRKADVVLVNYNGNQVSVSDGISSLVPKGRWSDPFYSWE